MHEAYTDNEKKTLRFLKEYKIANKEIEAELFEVYRKMNVENPLISDFYRFGHLQKLQDKVQKTIQQLGNLEEDYLKGRMKQGLVLGIETVINKIPETELNKRAIDQMIMRPWQGGNFSDRVWKNKRLLANQLNDKLRNGIIQGKSPFQIANDLSERMQVGRYQAQRLVRTEYMHVLNQGQIEGYKAKGYTKLKWHASKDERTCEICGKHHGNEYEIDEAPHLPAHPGCRCTFVPVIDVESAAAELKQAKEHIAKYFPKQYELNQAKRLGQKVNITEQAISKVKMVRIPGLSEIESRNIQIKHKELLDDSMRNNNSDETMYILKDSYQVSIYGNRVSVNPNISTDAVFLLNSSPSRSLDVLHNHPGLSSFSMNDLNFFMSNQSVRTLTIVTNQGKVMYITKTDHYNANLCKANAQKTLNDLKKNNVENQSVFVERMIKSFYNAGVRYKLR